MANGNFRVIIVGGGPVGLTMAHTLSKAGIDFVLLERRPEIGEDGGASIVVHAHALRVLSQVGLLEPLLDLGDAAIQNRSHKPDGSSFRKPRAFSEFEDFFGCSAHIFNRADLVRAIYNGLSKPDKSRVFTNKVVSDITTSDSGVTVSCADGTRYNGSIVVGADGTHSVVRKYMRTLALQAPSKPVDVDDEKPFLSSYRMMWCSFPAQGEGHGYGVVGTAQDTHDDGHSVQCLVGGKRWWMFVYERLPEPRQGVARYTEDDVIAYAEKWGHMHIDSKVKVRDAFAQRYHAGLSDLEEGILKHWSWGGRLVLMGDAAHKFTPNAGLGYNNGVQDAAVLTNELYRALHDSSSSVEPSAKTLAAAFDRYQTTRREGVESDLGFSAFATRCDAWPSTFYWFFDQWVMPLFPEWLAVFMMKRVLGSRIAGGRVLEFLSSKEPFSGSIPWIHPMRSQ